LLGEYPRMGEKSSFAKKEQDEDEFNFYFTISQ